MPSSKKKVYSAVMLLGGAALILDRCVLTPGVTAPKSVAASVATIASPAPTAASASHGSSNGTQTIATLELPFPRTIPAWNAQSAIRDIFAPFSDGDSPDKRRSRPPREAERGQGTCADMVSAHHLEAVLVQEGLKIAILDGAWVRIGESIGGCVLTEIVGAKVRFRCRDGDTVLTLPPGN